MNHSVAQPAVVIVGGGLAGLAAALALAPLPTLLVARAPLGTGACSGWAQGGIAAAVGADDSVALHVADTLAAGDGLCDPAAVCRIVGGGPDAIGWLRGLGARFDATLGLEAAHGRRRIVHAGDATGAEVMRAVIAAVRACPSISVHLAAASALLTGDGGMTGLALADGTIVAAAHVVLATGGVGGLFPHTTNPRGSWGAGLYMAQAAGARLADLEFVQFHPTALDAGADPMPLISEAVRGEGATLVDEHGTRFMQNWPRQELEPRDVVSRAVWAHLQAGHRTLLDTGRIADFAATFPAIAAICANAGTGTARIPIRPAAHYHMGGIAAAPDGATTIPGLWAVGECAATGLHGANRLASNSLLEAAVCGTACGEAIRASHRRAATPRSAPPPVAEDTAPVRPIMGAHLGVLRDEAGLRTAIARLDEIRSGPAHVAGLIARAALDRRESRGAHARTDFPARSALAA